MLTQQTTKYEASICMTILETFDLSFVDIIRFLFLILLWNYQDAILNYPNDLSIFGFQSKILKVILQESSATKRKTFISGYFNLVFKVSQNFSTRLTLSESSEIPEINSTHFIFDSKTVLSKMANTSKKLMALKLNIFCDIAL